MSKIAFTVPGLVDAGAWKDYRTTYKGGFGWRGDRAIGNIVRDPIHHTVTNPSGSADQDVATVANIHINGNRWGGIGYNFLITSEVKKYKGVPFAVVAYVGDVGTIRAHTPNTKGAAGIPALQGNTYMIASAVVGQLQNGSKLPTAAQLNSLYLLLKELRFEDERFTKLNKLKWTYMSQHRVYDPTYCATDKQAELLNGIKARAKYVDPVFSKEPEFEIVDMPDKVMTLIQDTTIRQFPGNTTGGEVKKGEEYTFVDNIKVENRNYYRTKWYAENDIVGGIQLLNLENIPVQDTPAPEEVEQAEEAITQYEPGYDAQGDISKVREEIEEYKKQQEAEQLRQDQEITWLKSQVTKLIAFVGSIFKNWK